MVNRHDPIALIDQYLVFIKLCHVCGGLYIWEFFTTLDYEWSVIQGRRPYRWTIWIYSFTRVTTLMAIILALVNLDAERPINCQLWIIFTFAFGYLSLSAALLLIVLRTIAIWDKNKIVTVFSIGIWVVYLAFIIQAISQLQSSWTGGVDTCNLPNMERQKIALIIMLTTDLALVFIMFLGLFRLRSRGGGTFGLGRLLWKQGIFWLLFAAGAGIIAVVFVCLNLSPLLHMMFVTPALISMSITATRIYTSLMDFGSSTNILVDSDLERRRRAGIPVVHVSRKQYPTPQGATLALDISGQPCDEPQGLALNDTLESGMGK